ncbi:hypothetical protein [Pseudodesulfovibrio sediminis]|uniref:Uncharacterized protein n=1 Tax=Pseudodesulfovibrio sediminis TaxID=2810563 RepID=A0ABM8I3J3_9BACT|nr:hypothetical protein [Pseudodesulfovibrio sediminis]BCS88630.1 hypothetical protein PSDVSF_18720 [Pseudodesulfovibrio sediminis]
MNSERIIGLAILCVCMIIATPIALSWNRALHLRMPHVRVYRWGYYLGAMGVMGYGLLALVATALVLTGETKAVVLAALFILCAVPFFFIIRRKRWAWIVGTILLFNPVLWIINAIYARHRWAEMQTEEISAKEERGRAAEEFAAVAARNAEARAREVRPEGESVSWWDGLSMATRAWIVGSLFWMAVVLVYVVIFKPYGGMSTRDIIHMIKVMFFPPLVANVGYSLYAKFVVRP